MPVLANVIWPSWLSGNTDSSCLTATLDDLSTAVTAILIINWTQKLAEDVSQTFIKQFKRNDLTLINTVTLETGCRCSGRCRRLIRTPSGRLSDTHGRFYALSTLTVRGDDCRPMNSLKRERYERKRPIDRRWTFRTLPFWLARRLADVRPLQSLSVKCPCFARSAADLHAEPPPARFRGNCTSGGEVSWPRNQRTL